MRKFFGRANISHAGRIAILLTCTFLIGCGGDKQQIDESTVFRYNEHANITSLDPAFAKDQRNIWAVHQLFNGLVRLDENLEVIPDIAKSWEISEDGLTYTFTLRDDVFFHEDEAFGKESPTPFNPPNGGKQISLAANQDLQVKDLNKLQLSTLNSQFSILKGQKATRKRQTSNLRPETSYLEPFASAIIAPLNLPNGGRHTSSLHSNRALKVHNRNKKQRKHLLTTPFPWGRAGDGLAQGDYKNEQPTPLNPPKGGKQISPAANQDSQIKDLNKLQLSTLNSQLTNPKPQTSNLKPETLNNEPFAQAKAVPRKVTALDVIYSLNRLQDPDLASPGSNVLNMVESMKAVNDTTVSFRLSEPFPAFLGVLTMKYCSVVPEEAVEYYGQQFSRNPVGTGPFYLKRWKENEKMVLRRNDNYFRESCLPAGRTSTSCDTIQLPYLEAVAITFLTDKQGEFLAFSQGKLDMLNALDPSYKDELLTTSGELRDAYAATVNMFKNPFLNTEYLGIYLDADNPDLRSRAMRQAINYGFDREKMIKYLRNNIGRPATSGFIPLGLPAGGKVDGYSYQPEKARKLIQQYIQETGDNNPSLTISTNANYLDLCEFIQKELEKLGLKVQVEVMPPSTLRQARSAGKLQSFRASWIADYPDAENYLALFVSNNFSPDGPNYTHFSSPIYDSLYQKAVRTTDVDQRLELYRQMDSTIMAEAPVVPLYYDESVRFYRKGISGISINAVNLLELETLQKTN